MNSFLPLKIFFSIVLMLIILVSGFYAADYYFSDSSSKDLKTFLARSKSVVLGEEAWIEGITGLSSEDYKISQVSVGGNMAVEDLEDIFRITGIANELVTSKEKDETKMVLSWKTNKAAIFQVEYAKNGESLTKKIKKEEFGYNHSVVLSSLDPSSVYNYVIKCQDRDGNQITSDKFVFYTGAPNVSLIDVLEEAAQKAFGWAIKNK